MTWPAAAVPSWPWERMSRVEARLSDSRSIVASSSTVGKEEKSSGRSMNSATIRTSTEKVIESARPMSSTSGGSGRTSTESSTHHAEREPHVGARGTQAQRPAQPVSGMAAAAAIVRPAGPAAARRCPRPAAARRGRAPVVAQLVAQRADGDAEDGGGVGAVAERVAACRGSGRARHRPPAADQARHAVGRPAAGTSARRRRGRGRARSRRRRSRRRRPAGRRGGWCSPARAHCRAS